MVKYTDDFKQRMVNLYTSGKPSSEIIDEYVLTSSTFHKWVKYHDNSGSFKVKDNLSPDR